MRNLTSSEVLDISGSGFISIIGYFGIRYNIAYIVRGPIGLGYAVAAKIAEHGKKFDD
tara:strand:+ start:156 stop:329 length:174 start_codon:yes stop_codon:yes gene_type:complete